MYLPKLANVVSQGDIFDDIPVAYLGQAGGKSDVYTLAVRAILISHDCEYDKPTNAFVLVAEVRSLSEVPEGSQGNVRGYRTRNTFYLQPVGHMSDSFADFRKINRIPKSILEERKKERLASLTDEARAALQQQIAIFFGYGR